MKNIKIISSFFNFFVCVYCIFDEKSFHEAKEYYKTFSSSSSLAFFHLLFLAPYKLRMNFFPFSLSFISTSSPVTLFKYFWWEKYGKEVVFYGCSFWSKTIVWSDFWWEFIEHEFFFAVDKVFEIKATWVWKQEDSSSSEFLMKNWGISSTGGSNFCQVRQISEILYKHSKVLTLYCHNKNKSWRFAPKKSTSTNGAIHFKLFLIFHPFKATKR